MNLSTLRKLIFEKNVFSLLRLTPKTDEIYRCAFATSAGSSGLLELLSQAPRPLGEIAQFLRLEAPKHRALEAWLACGVRAGELSVNGGKYSLKGRLSKLLASPRNAISASLFEEVTRYHYDAILHAPSRLHSNQPYTLADQDGELIARSSQVLEPLVEEAIDWVMDARSPASVLEVGCGSGTYLKYMARRRPSVQITALDIQADVVDLAKRNMKKWEIDDSIEIQHADIFDYQTDQRFDLITLHNNIYYFADGRRQALLETLPRLLKPSGRLLLTTSCRGGSTGIAALHLWWSLSNVAAGLPEEHRLKEELLEAGFSQVRSRRLLPGESYFAFVAET